MKCRIGLIVAVATMILGLIGCSLFPPQAEIVDSWMNTNTYDVTCTIQNTGSTWVRIGVLCVTWGYPEEDGCRALNQSMFQDLAPGDTVTLTVQYPGEDMLPGLEYEATLRELRTW
jgi:hypothetical protein